MQNKKIDPLKSAKYPECKINKYFYRFGCLISFFIIIYGSCFAQGIQPIELSWLGGEAPQIATGVSWGVPLPQSKVKPSSAFILTNEQGEQLPIQSWPMAYWPDGSLKWVGLSTIVDSASGNKFYLEPEKNRKSKSLNNEIKITDSKATLIINTGVLQCEFPKNGNSLFRSMKMNGNEVASNAQLICISQNCPEQETGAQPERVKYHSKIEQVTLEQSGPVRAVVKIEGTHISESGDRSWLPFIVRLYFYSGLESVKMVHTFIFDGDQHNDFIRGLGLVVDVPLDEQLYNRHIRFSGENGGFWDEPCQPLNGSFPLFDFKSRTNYYELQLKGNRIAEPESFDEKQQYMLKHWASWNDFKLMQPNADGFRVQKRTNDQSTWLDAGYGKRSEGMLFVGDVSGGLAVCMRDFWQSFPSALEASNVKSDKAQLKAWLWSPDAEAMDMRHYDTLAWGHSLEASYEDVQPGFSTPNGIARTSEILLYPTAKVPTLETLNEVVKIAQQPTLLTVSPEYMHSIPVFGVWSLPDTSSKGKQWIENQLDNAFKYYQSEVEQRHWYGFWNYGDVRHGYDQTRHTWKYDMGGYAWDNTELMPNLWLWYSYLRSGRKDVFRMAEAMTRHTGEVDVYHLGRFKGLGSRHNVVHWGGGAKEVRISQSALGRFYYYLTADERTGDLMRATVESSNEAIGKIDPLRLIMKESEYPTHIRVGPDWLALVGNWMTEWERTGDTKYRDRIMEGVNSLYKMPYGFFSGDRAAFGYDPKTYKLYRLDENDIGFLHLSVLMGGPEIAYELTHLLQNKKWNKLWMQFCKLYAAPVQEIKKEFGIAEELGDAGHWYARLPAYYYRQTGNQMYAKRAWDMFLNNNEWRYQTNFNIHKFDGIESLQPVYEIDGASTNNTAQWCLNAIQVMELAADQLPENSPRIQYEKGELLYEDYFFENLDNWIIETPESENSRVTAERGKLVVDVDDGATIWFKQKLSGNIMIEYRRKVVIQNGKNDRLSDMNQFWMANDPQSEYLFTRRGIFSEYHTLRQYYAGIGGNTNSTTRFRKYQGNGERSLIFDLQDEQHLLKPNKNYFIQIVVQDGTTRVYVDGELYFSFADENPLTEGYFGFRTVKSHQEIQGFKVFRLK